MLVSWTLIFRFGNIRWQSFSSQDDKLSGSNPDSPLKTTMRKTRRNDKRTTPTTYNNFIFILFYNMNQNIKTLNKTETKI